MLWLNSSYLVFLSCIHANCMELKCLFDGIATLLIFYLLKLHIPSCLDNHGRFWFFAPKLFGFPVFWPWIYPHEGYCRNKSCALIKIYTFFLNLNRRFWVIWYTISLKFKLWYFNNVSVFKICLIYRDLMFVTRYLFALTVW